MKYLLTVFFLIATIASFGQLRPKKYAVIVGVADYKKGGMDLRYSDDDAYRFYAYLLSCKGGGATDDDDNVACLIDEAATKKNILKTMEKIFSKAGPNDMLVFYFSGHGTKGAFCPYDTESSYSSLLQHSEIKAVFKRHKAKYKIVLSDACYSGSIYDGTPTGSNSQNNGQDANIVIIMSSEPSETSLENPRIRQGAFSYYLLKGLRGAANRDKDNVITLNELFPYIKANVLNFTKNRQTPILEGNASRYMPIGYLD